MRTFRIEYLTGYIELYTDKFFPCNQALARKIFHLVKKYCDYEQWKDLLQAMIDRERTLVTEGIDLEAGGDERALKLKNREIEQMRSNQLNFVKVITR